MAHILTHTQQGPIIPVVKLEAVGNDFLLVEESRLEIPAPDYTELAQRLCNRPFGIGSDGLLIIGRSEKAAFRMRMFNPDGTEDFCGNGLRCSACYAYEQGYVPDIAFEIEALDGVIVPAEVVIQEGRVEAVTITLPPPSFHPSEVPALFRGNEITKYRLTLDERTWEITAVNTGTTHTVIFVDVLPDDPVFFHDSPQIEHHSLFPERTSVMWCVVESREQLRVRIWERGVGETLGCGTGACAVTTAARRAGKVDEQVQVMSKGGLLLVHWNPGDSIHLSGPVNLQMKGTYFP
jgi:diaminopimelate epimerase